MIVRDWGDARGDVLAPLYEQERRHWDARFAWDTSDTWLSIEQARVTWGLPGAIALDRMDRVAGWMFYLLEDHVLTIGGLVAASAAATAALLDAALADGHRRGAAISACFVPDRAEGLQSALSSRGFSIELHRYLARRLSPMSAGDASADAWRRDDTGRAASLLQAAYPDEAGCHFAPRGTPAEWLRYMTNLVEQTGCGALEPQVTRVVREDDRIGALALVTRISSQTLHLAQLAVHPGLQRRGLAGRLLADATARGLAAGFSDMTLLVGEGNYPARALYARLGFTQRAAFVAARRGP